MGRVVHFEIPTDDPERAGRFYREALGWEITAWGGGDGGYWLVKTGPEDRPGIDGGMMRREHPAAHVHVVAEVASVDEACRAVQAAGGAVAVQPFAIPHVGRVAYCTDTEGNSFGLLEPAMD